MIKNDTVKNALRDEIVQCVKTAKRMTHVHDRYIALHPSGHNFLQFIGKSLTCVSDEEIAAYVNTMIVQLTAELADYRRGYVYIQDIMYYIFGSYFCHAVFAADVRNKDNEYLINSPRFRLLRIIMRTCWPYCYANFYRCHGSAYKTMGLSDEEAAEYDAKYYARRPRSNEDVRDVSILDIKDVTFPNGSTYDDIRGWVEDYFRECVSGTRIIPTKDNIYKYIRTSPRTEVIQDLRHMIENSIFRRRLSQIIDDVAHGYIEKFVRENGNEICSQKTHIVLYIRTRGQYSLRNIDASMIVSERLQEEIRIFRIHILMEYGCTTKYIQNVNKVIDILHTLQDEFHIEKSGDIKKEHIYLYLHDLQMKKYSPLTINANLNLMKLFIKTLQTDEEYCESAPALNVANHISFCGSQNFVRSRAVIPDDIIVFIDDHLDELPDDIRLIYAILRITTWRLNEVTSLTVNDFYPIGSDEYMGIRTRISKTRASIRKKNISETIEDVIPCELYDQIQSYIEKTSVARKDFGTDLVFFSGRNNAAKAYSHIRFNDELNDLLKRHGIHSVDESYDGLSSAQIRTTGATQLIEAGMALPIISKKMGHLNNHTTANYYTRVRNEKLSDKDADFFTDRFDVLFDDEKKSVLTDDKRRELYREFKISMRSVEFGECTEDICSSGCRRRGTVDCATCPNLVTGPQHLDVWRSIKKSSDDRLAEFETIYREKGVCEGDYSGFPEYAAEMRRNTSYQSVITRITGEK